MKKFPIELNGIANLRLLIENPIGSDDYNRAAVLQQIDLLERYMLALADAAEQDRQPPFWHEVRANLSDFPTRAEKARSAKWTR